MCDQYVAIWETFILAIWETFLHENNCDFNSYKFRYTLALSLFYHFVGDKITASF